MTAAATKATFSDFRIIKSRNVAVLHFEVPLEGADAALAALGGLPQPATERWCGIARLTEEAARKPDARERYHQAPEGHQAMVRAALLCEDAVFRSWAAAQSKRAIVDIDDASSWLKAKCGISSRRELSTDPLALKEFLDLEARFKSERAFGPHATR